VADAGRRRSVASLLRQRHHGRSNPLFSLTNTGSGVGVEAVGPSQDLTGRLVTSNAGVYGHTMRCGGEYRGVIGVSTCTSNTGELGRPDAGVRGVGAAGPGVRGESADGEGVSGAGGAYGVHGASATGDGVFGESTASNKSGLYAVNINPNGFAGTFNGKVQINGPLACTGCVTNTGIGDGAITKGKVSATGAGTNGQVLGTDGANLIWQNASGLTLPYSDQATTTGNVFDISNLATGSNGAAIAGHFPQHGVHGVLGGASIGVSGESINGVGVRGTSSTAAGVKGSSGYYGVMGTSSNADGVTGTTTKSTASGVSGGNDSTGTGGALGSQFAGADGHGSPYGVRGQSDDNTGVYGTGGGYGVHGTSATGDGVFAESTAGYKAGLYAVNDNGAGYAVVARGRVKNTLLEGGGAVYADADGVLTLSASDARLKVDVADLAGEIDVIAVLSQLRGVAFNWDLSAERARRLGAQRQIGLVAQEVEPVLPQVVGETADGYRTLDYAKLTAFLIEVAKAQQKEIAAQRFAIAGLRAKVERLAKP